MARSTDSTHVHNLIPDYVLGLLPGDQANWVAAHTSHCGACRRTLAQEQQISRSVKLTLSRATRPDEGRLRRLMPPTPASPPARSTWSLFSPGMAAAGIMLILLFSAIALFASQRPGTWGLSAPTARSTAAMLTETPTQTATRELTATAEGLEAASRPAAAVQAASVSQAIVPAPAIIPVPAARILH